MSFNWINQYFYNDLNMLPLYIMMFLIALFIMAAAVFFHELGHLIYFRYKLKKKDVKIRFVYYSLFDFGWEAGSKRDYVSLSSSNYKDMLIAGISFGVLPILFSGFIFFPFLLLLIPYFVGCRSDIKQFINWSE